MPTIKVKKEDGSWEYISAGSVVGNFLSIEKTGANEGEIPLNNADTLGGKTEIELSVAKAVDSDKLGGYLADEYVKHTQLQNKPKAGFIYPLASEVVPDGFLLCDGAEYSREEYPELFIAIGTTYGEGDGSTTFNVPNLQTRVAVGAGEGYELGNVGGEETHTLTVDEIPNIQGTLPHVANGEYKVSGVFSFEQSGVSKYEGASSTSVENNSHYLMNFGNDQPHNNMQPYTVVNYIIATGKNSTINVLDIITDVQTIPLSVEYGGSGATNAEDARKNIGAMSMELLWENASPNSAMSSQTITMDCSNCAFFVVALKTHITSTAFRWHIARKNVYSTLNAGYAYVYRQREIIITDTGVEIGDGKIDSYNSGSGGSTDNDGVIITHIYGIKGVS